jgi:alanyl-tRNA synthetase
MARHLTADQVRTTFIEFFKGKPSKQDGHTFVPSSPCVPVDDPTLLFTNAGMNQFKPIFLGQADPGSEMGRLKRAVNSQKCIRAGGKHNDLEDVGKDTYHHTFFEMLGNWSFGDYFKAEAIAWSWELLTEVYGLPKEALYATYFGGDEKAGLAPDLETRDLWLRHLPKERVLPGNMKDNFWMMGDTGPCGPCTEIHADRLVALGESNRVAPELVNSGDPDVIEVWNNVFIQFDAEYSEEGLAALHKWDSTPEAERGKLPFKSRTEIEAKYRTLTPLPAKHVDTGMGLERLVSILQRKRSNYDTDVFAPIFAAIERLTNAPHPYSGKLGAADKGNVDTAYRVIADHIRTLTFAITDGAVPSNVGRGYVLRRILRRAVRYGRQMLGAKTGFFAQLVPVVVDRFGDAFPELRKDPQRVQKIILEEEESFGKTLDRGIKLFEQVAAEATGGTITGADAFKLYDTYGFPIDLTVLMAEERGIRVDIAGFEKAVEAAKDLSRTGGAAKADAPKALTLGAEEVARLKHLNIAATDDSHKFVNKDIRARVQAIWNGENFDEVAHAAHADRPIGIITDRTCFYAQMGGQEGDTGRITLLNGSEERDPRTEFVVEDTKTFGGYVLHIGRLRAGELRVGDSVLMDLDQKRRLKTAGNHTATHLTNLLLREVLGTHVDQKGSLVAPDRMRFDFSHSQPVTPAELERIEKGVAERVAQDLPVYAEQASLVSAKQINTLRAVFGEVYPDPVRVVSIGAPVADLLAEPQNEKWMSYSVEFCGGTHVNSTGQIGSFAIIAEEAVAKGIRRVVAVTGEAAAEAHQHADAIEKRISAAGGLPDTELGKAVQELTAELDGLMIPAWRKAACRAMLANLQERVKEASKRMGAAIREEAVRQARGIAESAVTANEQVIVATIEAGDNREALQAAMKTVRERAPKAAVMLFSVDAAGGKVAIMSAVPEALIAKGLKAGDWLRDAAAVVGGKGGGKPDAAQGGGTDVGKVNEAIKAARTAALRLIM